METLARESGLRVQTGGGIRDEAQVAALLAAGVPRVIVGSLAVRSPDLVRGWIKSFGPEHIVLSPDVRLDDAGIPRIAAAGWQETTGVALDDFLNDYPCRRAGPHPLHGHQSRRQADWPELRALCSARAALPHAPDPGFRRRLVTRRPARAENHRLRGAIVGRALYENKFTLSEALSCS
ncbi:MAG: HisA/HisF-related TIM barrel protein [Lacunisphaera sp.]